VSVIRIITVVLAATLSCGPVAAATASPDQSSSHVRMVIVLSRHGVRSPTHPAELAAYASKPWPTWSGQPGNLTEHGAGLMRQFGAYYRRSYGSLLGFPQQGCPPAGSVFVWADVDQRTRATGDALLAGFAPGCGIVVGHHDSDPDPLFDPLPGVGVADKAESRASVLGAVGGGFTGLPDAYGAAFATMESVLGCESPAACKQISRVPTTIDNTGDGGLASISGGLDMAADVAENLLLEYTNGNSDVGWGRVDRARLLELLQLHVFAKSLEHNRYAARAHSSNIMAHILQTLKEGATSAAVAGTRVPPQSRFVFLAGHDTQLAELAGLLGLSWLITGDQMNDTPPGSALIFELNTPARSGSQPVVRTFFTAQTLDAMRAGQGEDPVRVPVYVPGCPAYDCPLATFEKIVGAAIDPKFVTSW
jgi:4-phytase/acid phosphatase